MLNIDWATHEAADFACRNWHYSKCMPIGNTVKVGVWEDERYVGCVLFSHGTAKDLGTKYGLTQFECVELTRVALGKHKTPVSRIVAIALKFLKKQCPGIKLVVSFADSSKGHHGGIYQAGNWIFCGNSSETKTYMHRGKEITSRTFHEIYKTDRSFKNKVQITDGKPKYRYLMPLDQSVRKAVSPLSRPYPKRAASRDIAVLGVQPREGGESPTAALQSDEA